MKFDLVRWTRKDDKSPRTYVAHCSPGESGVCVFRACIDGDTHFTTDARHHLICFQLTPHLRLDCRMAGRQLRHETVRGALAICPAGIDCAVAPDRPADALFVTVEPAQFALAAAEEYGVGVELIHRMDGYDQRLMHAAQMLANESAQGSPNGPLFWNDVASSFIGRLLFGHTSRPGLAARGRLGQHALMTIKEYVLTHLAEPIAVEDLAALAGRSPFHFSRIFTRSVGVPPHRYVIHLRLKQAIRQMREGRLGLAAIAAETGFADQSHLSRWVRRVHGVAPSEIV
jgi:AraC family transcriptional regulator